MWTFGGDATVLTDYALTTTTTTNGGNQCQKWEKENRMQQQQRDKVTVDAAQRNGPQTHTHA